MSRFTIERPPIPRDAIADSKTLADPPQYVGIVKIGHADAWIEGAEYEHDRIMALVEREQLRLMARDCNSVREMHERDAKLRILDGLAAAIGDGS